MKQSRSWGWTSTENEIIIQMTWKWICGLLVGHFLDSPRMGAYCQEVVDTDFLGLLHLNNFHFDWNSIWKAWSGPLISDRNIHTTLYQDQVDTKGADTGQGPGPGTTVELMTG